MTVFLSLLNRWESAQSGGGGRGAWGERADIPGRWTRRYEEEGEAGLLDRRLGKASGWRIPSDRADEVERLYRERYQGFTVKHFHEHLVKDHGFGWGSTWLKLHLQWAGSRRRRRARGRIGASASGGLCRA
jgi:hypothetical protein